MQFLCVIVWFILRSNVIFSFSTLQETILPRQAATRVSRFSAAAVYLIFWLYDKFAFLLFSVMTFFVLYIQVTVLPVPAPVPMLTRVS